MKKQTHHSLAPLAPSTWSDPNTPSVPGVKILIPPELNARPDRPFVVSADNKPAPVAMLIVTLAGIFALGLLAFLALRYLGNLDGLLSFVLSTSGVVVLVLVALFLLSGDVPALLEVQKAERNERRRIEAVENIALAQVEVQKYQVQVQHVDAKARYLEAKVEEDSIRLALMDRAEKQADANLLENFEKPPHTFTPADPELDPAYDKVIHWVKDGLRYDPATGRITGSVPWGRTGTLTPTEAKRVREWIEKDVNPRSPHGWVFKQDEHNMWFLNTAYTSVREVHEDMRKVPLHKRG